MDDYFDCIFVHGKNLSRDLLISENRAPLIRSDQLVAGWDIVGCSVGLKLNFRKFLKSDHL